MCTPGPQRGQNLPDVVWAQPCARAERNAIPAPPLGGLPVWSLGPEEHREPTFGRRREKVTPQLTMPGGKGPQPGETWAAGLRGLGVPLPHPGSLHPQARQPADLVPLTTRPYLKDFVNHTV